MLLLDFILIIFNGDLYLVHFDFYPFLGGGSLGYYIVFFS